MTLHSKHARHTAQRNVALSEEDEEAQNHERRWHKNAHVMKPHGLDERFVSRCSLPACMLCVARLGPRHRRL